MISIHKSTKLAPLMRRALWADYQTNQYKITALAKKYQVSRPIVYRVLERARLGDFYPRKSTNHRYLQVAYGIKRLAKIERRIEAKKQREAKRYNKSYPGEMMHFDTKRLPLLQGERRTMQREYLFVGIDDFSRELYAGIYCDKSQHSAAAFLKETLSACPYTVEVAYSDNGTEYKGSEKHAFRQLCTQHRVAQRFTRVKTPRTNGKAERMIRTLMEMWHQQEQFSSRTQRQQSLVRFINFYNTVKGHAGLQGLTPMATLEAYFFGGKL